MVCSLNVVKCCNPEDTTEISGYAVNLTGSGSVSIPAIFGALSYKGNVTGNAANVTGGSVDIAIGGISIKGEAKNNTATVSNGTVTDALFGGVAKAKAENNTVTITGGTVKKVYAGCAAGSSATSSDGIANSNKVEISGGTISSGGQVVGGYSPKLTTLQEVFPAFADVLAPANGGTAAGNSVTISGSPTFESGSKVYGAYAKDDVDNNTVTVSGSPTFAGNNEIYGGFSEEGAATNNTVNLLTQVSVSKLVGGQGGNGTSTGNTLNVAAKGITTGELNGFQNMNFYLPSDIANGDTMVTVNGGAATDLTGVTYGVAAQQGASLSAGDSVKLVYNASGLTTDSTLKTASSDTVTASAPSGWTTDTAYTFTLGKPDANTITATLDGVQEVPASDDPAIPVEQAEAIAAERMKSPVETRAAAVTLLNSGADLLASQGFQQAANAVALDMAERQGEVGDQKEDSKQPGMRPEGSEGLEGPANTQTDSSSGGGYVPFVAIGGSNLRAESGSHVNVDGIGLNVGFARELPNKQGKLLVGPIVEYGRGNYDSYLNDGTHGDGSSRYWGAGIMARQTNWDGLYYEGSFRGGQVKADYAANLTTTRRASYDSKSSYFAMHLGVGKAIALKKDNVLDCYLKYFYSHTAGDDVTATITNTLTGASANAGMNFSSVDSHRVRLGARLTHTVNERNKLYGGLAYQYEFDGDARATYNNGTSAPSPSVKGSSGMLELGWQVKPGGRMTLDLGVIGWIGKQRGVTGHLGAMWQF